MISVIIGHRGSGKTQLLSTFKNAVCLDLDKEIELFSKKSIESIFLTKGENFFRSLEKKVFNQILDIYKNSTKTVYISLGAGFSEKIPQSIKVIWLQRKTDVQQRIFFNRPRLNIKKTASQEYKDRFLLREKYYKSVCHETLCLPEYFFLEKLNKYKKDFFFDKDFFSTKIFFSTLKDLINLYFLENKKTKKKLLLNKAGLVLQNTDFKNKTQAKAFLQKRLSWNFLFFEIRDDLVSKNNFNLIKSIIPSNKLLLSFRAKKTYFTKKDLLSAWAWDWPLERTLKACPFNLPFSIVSLHKKKSLIKNTFKYAELQIKKANAHNLKYKSLQKVHCKLALTIKTLSELKNLYDWFKKDNIGRSILPMSKTGRWAWFRLYMYGKIKINFIKEDRDNFIKDSILLADKLLSPQKVDHFSALIGGAITHSLTPFVHHDFFLKAPSTFSSKALNQNKTFNKNQVKACDNMPVFLISLNKNEVNIKNINFLKDLGLRCAAITSPLKKDFFNLKSKSIVHSACLKKRKSVNTLVYLPTKKHFILNNTDQEGLQILLKTFIKDYGKSKTQIALWGAGSVATMLAQAYPDIFIFSAQKKLCISHKIDEKKYSPDSLVWAVPSIYKTTTPKHWRPKQIIDLNYSKDSLGREYALLKNADYTNALLMFLVQAKKQQEFWTKQLTASVHKSFH